MIRLFTILCRGIYWYKNTKYKTIMVRVWFKNEINLIYPLIIKFLSYLIVNRLYPKPIFISLLYFNCYIMQYAPRNKVFKKFNVLDTIVLNKIQTNINRI